MSDLTGAVTAVELAVFLDPARHVSWTLNGAGKLVCGFSARVMGWTIVETSGSAAATINIYDGADTTGEIALPIKIASAGSSTDWFGPNGVLFRNAVYVNLASGQAQGTIFYNHVRR
jgi:hypothetical protein